MKQRKIPMRTCIACRQSKTKGELMRVVRDKEGSVSIDKTGKKNGRGAYLCDDIKCLEKAIKSNAIGRALEVNVEETVIMALKDEYEREKN